MDSNVDKTKKIFYSNYCNGTHCTEFICISMQSRTILKLFLRKSTQQKKKTFFFDSTKYVNGIFDRRKEELKRNGTILL